MIEKSGFRYAPHSWGIACILPLFFLCVTLVSLQILFLATSTSKYYTLIQLYYEEDIDYNQYLMIFFWNHNISVRNHLAV